jgi:hypothetical protein
VNVVGSIILWDSDKIFTFIKYIEPNSDILLQLTNGMLLFYSSDYTKNLSVNAQINVTSKLRNHKKILIKYLR